MTTVRSMVYVVDDDASVRKSLARLLSATGYQVAVFSSAREFLAREHAVTDCPACLILDLRMPDVDGLHLQALLRDAGDSMPILFASGYADVVSSVRAMKVGAVDFLTKPIDPDQLLEAVEAAIQLDSARRRTRADLGALHQRLGRLTPRERQVMGLVATGLLNKQIAGRLGTCERTIKAHRARVMQKMEAGSVAELVRMSDSVSLAERANPREPMATETRRRVS
jgi:FixJ family two-component response regulator